MTGDWKIEELRRLAPDLAEGRSTAQIADRLGISNHTVRNHVRGITQGLGVHSRLEAVLRASDAGLV